MASLDAPYGCRCVPGRRRGAPHRPVLGAGFTVARRTRGRTQRRRARPDPPGYRADGLPAGRPRRLLRAPEGIDDHPGCGGTGLPFRAMAGRGVGSVRVLAPGCPPAASRSGSDRPGRVRRKPGAHLVRQPGQAVLDGCARSAPPDMVRLRTAAASTENGDGGERRGPRVARFDPGRPDRGRHRRPPALDDRPQRRPTLARALDRRRGLDGRGAPDRGARALHTIVGCRGLHAGVLGPRLSPDAVDEPRRAPLGSARADEYARLRAVLVRRQRGAAVRRHDVDARVRGGAGGVVAGTAARHGHHRPPRAHRRRGDRCRDAPPAVGQPRVVVAWAAAADAVCCRCRGHR